MVHPAPLTYNLRLADNSEQGSPYDIRDCFKLRSRVAVWIGIRKDGSVTALSTEAALGEIHRRSEDPDTVWIYHGTRIPDDTIIKVATGDLPLNTLSVYA